MLVKITDTASLFYILKTDLIAAQNAEQMRYEDLTRIALCTDRKPLPAHAASLCTYYKPPFSAVQLNIACSSNFERTQWNINHHTISRVPYENTLLSVRVEKPQWAQPTPLLGEKLCSHCSSFAQQRKQEPCRSPVSATHIGINLAWSLKGLFNMYSNL